MALNFSHRPIFSGHLSEDNLVSPIRVGNGYRVEDIQEKNGDGFGKTWLLNKDVEDCYDCRRERIDRVGSQETVSNDILDLLPSDPFGMDISTTFTAISGWLEGLEVDYGGYRSNEVRTNNKDYQLFAGLNFIWSNAMRFQVFQGNTGIERNSDGFCGFDGFSREKESGNLSCGFSFESTWNADNIISWGIGSTGSAGHETEQGHVGCAGSSNYGDGTAPHAALSYALGYLGVQDLLSTERVCRSLRSTIEGDPLLWRSIHIDQPLNEKITDDVLLQLTNRAQGNLQCLSLVDCPRITDNALKCILESNSRLAKLSVPGCTRISIEGIVSSLKAFKTLGSPGVKNIRVGGLYGVTPKHYEELKFLLGADNGKEQYAHKPHFYHRGKFYLSCDDERAIDIEMCPRCQNLRLVYDCPAEGCQVTENPSQACRACTICVPRCVQCGHCINGSEYEETFCLDWLCSDCLKLQLTCQEGRDSKASPSK